MSVTPEEMKLVTSRLDLLENKQQDLAIAHDNLEIKVSKKFVNLDRWSWVFKKFLGQLTNWYKVIANGEYSTDIQ